VGRAVRASCTSNCAAASFGLAAEKILNLSTMNNGELRQVLAAWHELTNARRPCGTAQNILKSSSINNAEQQKDSPQHARIDIVFSSNRENCRNTYSGLCAPMSNKKISPSRQRWMFYPIYAAAALVGLSATVLLFTLNETCEFIGKSGVEYCWMYGSFERYLFTHLTLIGVDIGVLLSLYWLARLNYLLVYLIIWAAWLLGEPVLSFFDMSYC
jgi:hypothetical protein